MPREGELPCPRSHSRSPTGLPAQCSLCTPCSCCFYRGVCAHTAPSPPTLFPVTPEGNPGDRGPGGGKPGPQSLPTPRAPPRGGEGDASSIHSQLWMAPPCGDSPDGWARGVGGRGTRGWGGCGAEGQLPGCGAASSPCASEASSAQSCLPMRWQLAAHLGCVLLRCFQLDLDLGTRRVPRLAGVWVG